LPSAHDLDDERNPQGSASGAAIEIELAGDEVAGGRPLYLVAVVSMMLFPYGAPRRRVSLVEEDSTQRVVD
jgi:hypothetical protein